MQLLGSTDQGMKNILIKYVAYIETEMDLALSLIVIITILITSVPTYVGE